MNSLYAKITNLFDQDFYNFEEGESILNFLTKHKEDIENFEEEYQRKINKLKDSLKDLKDEIREYYVDGQDYVELRKQKDKEIEELKKDIKSQKAVADLYLTIASSSATKMSIVEEVRKHICEEIREQCVYTAGTKQVCPDTSISTHNLNEILNKIERGVENEN